MVIKNILFGIVIGVVGCILFYISLQEFNRHRALKKHAISLQAKVIDLSYQNRLYCPVLSYTYQQQTYTYTSSSCSKPARYEVGDHVTILIQHANPQEAFIDDAFEWMVKPSLLMLLGLVCIMGSFKIMKS
jgi:hypothetical protein